MVHVIEPLSVPLHADERGTIRVGGTRVTLDSVVAAYETGYTAEQIADSYDVLSLGDIYAAIAYYLQHRRELEPYFKEGEASKEALRKATEEQLPPGSPLRERLLARRRERYGR